MAYVHPHNEKTLFGTTLGEGRFVRTAERQRYAFQSNDKREIFLVDEPTVFRNILLLGSPGCGKTNVMNQIVEQAISWNSESKDGVNLIFDTKGDYLNHPGFYRYSKDVILGNDAKNRHRSVVWNLFDEVLADSTGSNSKEDELNYMANAREVAYVLFKERGSTSQPFFCNAARDIFAHMIIYFIRRNRDDPAKRGNILNNYDFVQVLMNKNPADFIKMFNMYDDMKGLISYIGDGNNNQALGVLAELRSMVSDCFTGVFCQKSAPNQPYFSIRRAIREKKGRNIFLEYDMSVGEVLIPIYRLIIDIALKEALSEHSNGHTHIFLDELKLLPKSTHLEDALNFGRSKRVSVVAGLQSVGQIYSTYGEEAGQVILGGFGSVFAMNTSDYRSRKYVSDLFGTNVVGYRYYDSSNSPVDRERDGFVVEDWDLREMKRGQAVIGLASQEEPFSFTFEKDYTEG